MNLYDLLREYDDHDAIIIIFGEMYIHSNKKFVYDYCKRELFVKTYTKVINTEGVPVFVCDELNPGFRSYGYAC